MAACLRSSAATPQICAFICSAPFFNFLLLPCVYLVYFSLLQIIHTVYGTRFNDPHYFFSTDFKTERKNKIFPMASHLPLLKERKRKKECSDRETETAASEGKKIESMEYADIQNEEYLDTHLDVPRRPW